MIRSFLIIVLILIGNCSLVYSQSSWASFVANSEKGLVSFLVDMSLEESKPNYKNLLIVGKRTNKCYKNGIPKEDGLEELYVFSDSLETRLNKISKNRLAGVVTFKCYGLDIYYVKDTTNLRKEIDDLVATAFDSTSLFLTIKADRKWEYYQRSLNPNRSDEDFYINQELLTKMVYAGDDLSKRREVRHWFYFRDKNDRYQFSEYIKRRDFKVDSILTRTKRKYPYELQVIRDDNVDPKSIDDLTKFTRNLSRVMRGVYDGWGTETIVDE